MLKFSHTDFEIDLTTFGVTITEEANFFEDDFFNSYSFPFNVPIEIFKGLENFETRDFIDTYPGYITNGNSIQGATLTIQEIEGLYAKVNVNFGLEEFSEWSTSLNELNLEDIPQENIYAHAQTMVDKKYPEVNYNFPMIHDDRYKGTRELEDFEGTVNKRINGRFVENTSDPNNNIYQNKNIMLPMPFAMYLLKRGFELSGYKVAGDILNNTALQNIIVVPSKKIEMSNRAESVEWLAGGGIWTKGKTVEIYDLMPINLRGKFRVTGTVFVANKRRRLPEKDFPKIFFNSNLIWSKNTSEGDWIIDFIVDGSMSNENKLEFKASSILFGNEPNLEVKIIPIELYDSEGNFAPPSPSNSYKNLNQYLPNITFGEYAKAIMSLGNYELIPVGNKVYINHRFTKLQTNEIVDLSYLEAPKPVRKPTEYNKIVFYFKNDLPAEDSSYAHFSNNGFEINKRPATKEEKKIEIKALPLPLENLFGIYTATVQGNDDNLCLVSYNGLQGSKNTTTNNSLFNLTYIINKFWLLWLRFLVNGITFKWNFKVYNDEFTLTKNHKVFAYNNSHLIKSMQKKITPSAEGDVLEVEIKTKVVR